MALIPATAANQKNSLGKVNYISASDGAGGFVWLIDSASPTSTTTDAVVLANLPADTWTDFPASTIVTAPNDYTILDAANNIDITDGLLTRRNGANWQLLSSVAMTNLTINLRG